MTYYNPDKRQQFYLDKMIATGGRCEVCGREERLVVDHDHVTGRLRGLLCYRHNMGMGMFEDSPVMLDTASKYLRAAGTTGDGWLPKRKRTKLAPIFRKNNIVQQVALELMQQDGFTSDRARARELATITGTSYAAAQTRIVRLRRELRCETDIESDETASLNL